VSRFARSGLAILLLVASVGGYLWWSSPERQIRRVLGGVAELLSHDAPATPLDAISTVSALQPYFAPAVTIEPGEPFEPVNGRDAVMAAVAQLRSRTAASRIEFLDLQIRVAGDNRSASVDCTAMATLQDRAGQESIDAREVMVTMNVVNGRWVITWVRAVDVLEPVTR
jgi:hypothetical protein